MRSLSTGGHTVAGSMAWMDPARGEAMLRYALRRLLIFPLMLVLTAVIVVLLPVVALVQAIAALGVVFGRRARWRVLRLWTFAAAYCLYECLSVLACLLLWLGGARGRPWC